MSHKASAYVKHLVKASDGTRITVQEKAILCQLAEDHREESGVAFPSMKYLALRSCVTVRNCRRIIARLEQKGILQRTATRRRDGGGQTSNLYVFCALDEPSVAERFLRSGLDLLKVPRLPMAETGGPYKLGASDPVRRERRTSGAASPGHVAPSIESLNEQNSESHLKRQLEQNTPITPSQANREHESATSHQDKKVLNLRLAQIGFGTAVDSVREALMRLTPPAFEKRQGYRNGVDEWKAFLFGDMALRDCHTDCKGGLVLVVSSPDLEVTKRGLEKYSARWGKALLSAFGKSVRITFSASGEGQRDGGAKSP